jgi:hypothetical protein
MLDPVFYQATLEPSAPVLIDGLLEQTFGPLDILSVLSPGAIDLEPADEYSWETGIG